MLVVPVGVPTRRPVACGTSGPKAIFHVPASIEGGAPVTLFEITIIIALEAAGAQEFSPVSNDRFETSAECAVCWHSRLKISLCIRCVGLDEVRNLCGLKLLPTALTCTKALAEKH